ncbi:uncharacterized protein LOC122535608 [Frieseomelitta varia]|uniref:uncharacterized protein LOC122535608 n=1 Tax=Frieseomelitta varia TaxID=561572 RepID=UPI001CB67FD6|nr:uncharacterized protein LOC122535608 [Frieseomelitta varia]
MCDFSAPTVKHLKVIGCKDSMNTNEQSNEFPRKDVSHHQLFDILFWGKSNDNSKPKNILYTLHFPQSFKELVMLQKKNAIFHGIHFHHGYLFDEDLHDNFP